MKLARSVRACLERDLALAASYRFDVALQAVAVAVFLTVLFFLARLIPPAGEVGNSGGYFPFAVIGVVTASLLDSAYSSVASVLRTEQALGTIEESLLAAPRAFHLVIGGAVLNVLRALLAALAYLAGATLAHGWFLHGSVLLIAAVQLLAMAAFASLGFLSASFIVVFKRGDPLNFLARGAALLLGGVLYPVSALPAWLASVSRVLPVTWAIDANRAVLLRGASAREVAQPLLCLAAFVAVVGPLSLFCLRRALARAMRDGTLTHF